MSSSTAVAFLTNMNGKYKSRSPGAIQVKNWQTTISIEEKLDVTSKLVKGEQIVGVCCNVRLAHSSICDSADRIKESAKSGTKVFV
jgi:S-methylmethionine-dependent homocysteine/selenocysteine methylase